MLVAMKLMLIAGCGAAIGSMLRFALLELARHFSDMLEPLMVLAINLAVAFFAGVLIGYAPMQTHTFWATGILGGFSTFSAPMVSLADGLEVSGERSHALLQFIILMIGGLICFQIGRLLGQLI
ncbi:CrcB protein [Weissella uvarum]|uniref:fluoride efflux transporter FluC n=1 Tax=Weissella uvarum TaxID=1479233 RepID=UPI00195FB5FD|nr:CrcB family protein [Weissella uvarum]MBM7617817.1 CrcB protein [Weissella uvarum]MCM0595804.1 CrcB family protein [Weissella uvarum]